MLAGELAVNIADKKLYVGNSGGAPLELTSQGVTDVSIGASGLYATQATGSIGLGLAANVLVSGTLHVSGVVNDHNSALRIYAGEDAGTLFSQWITAKSYAGQITEIAGNDSGDLIFRTDSNVVFIEPTGGQNQVYINSNAATGNLYTSSPSINIGNSSATTTFAGDVNILKSLTAEHIHGELDGAVVKECKNTDSIALRKGDPVYITGTVGATDVIEV
ncbi:MAG: hypothetical protein EB003_12790, partial [Flavobacteriia bacterium]|nr:hypothetical protein [Flavobacteriia bacterium]